MFHVIGMVTQIWPVLLQGGTLIISPQFDAGDTNRRLADPALGVTHYFCVPQMADALRNSTEFKPAKWTMLKALFTGGAPNPASRINWWLDRGVCMVDGYGMTETGPLTDVRVVNDEDLPVDNGVPGEIQVLGCNVFIGYLNRARAISQTFTTDGWFRTGDIGRRDADGFIYIMDRKKDMFISGGENIYPTEVEAALLSHPAVHEVAVVGVPDETWGEVGLACVVTQQEAIVASEDLVDHCRTLIARYKVPKRFVFAKSLPRTDTNTSYQSCVAMKLRIALTVTVLAEACGAAVTETSAITSKWLRATPESSCDSEPIQFELFDLPYSNYFYSDCHTAAQVVVTSPLGSSDLTIIGPRLLVAWPAGNSGIAAFFQPQNGVNGSLSIALANSSTSGRFLDPVYQPTSTRNPTVGITSQIILNSSARLTVSILGSVRTIRDFTEGPSILVPDIQDAVELSELDNGGIALTRLWLDNTTLTTLSFSPSSAASSISIKDGIVEFDSGVYVFNASFNYPQLEQLGPDAVLNPDSKSLIAQDPDQTLSLSFLSYTDKILAGAWRFLTYFGRDSMISMLLLEPVLSAGDGSFFEAGISAVLERINKTDGSVAHEETIGDYATYLNLQENVSSTDPVYDYKMVDTDYFLPVLLYDYFIKNEIGRTRTRDFLQQSATENPNNEGLTYMDLALLSARKIMDSAAPFAAEGGQIRENLIHLKEGQPVGEWRDSNDGLGGGRIPFDVNTALVPAALRAISALSEAGLFPEYPDWAQTANKYAQIWEDHTLHFFEVNILQEEAKSLVNNYVSSNEFHFPNEADSIESDISFYGLALEGNSGQDIVQVMHTDDCFRHFLLNTTNQTQLSSFLGQTADHILRPFPVGLSMDIGIVVANPAYSGLEGYAKNFSNSAYHGTVVWSWQLSMMAAGLERQLARCGDSGSVPDFCDDDRLYSKIIDAYNHLWDLINANSANLGSEVWSWKYENGKFVSIALGELTPTESNIRQLWSLTFLAVERNEEMINKAIKRTESSEF
ncbi:Long-chain-fatty-acid--CoA ligase FadD13 [Paramyrothecium foliicola]|nr:Long-chain-fatty-acid--CoA ligase FadD13 [Paramyrothecium foliicola]